MEPRTAGRRIFFDHGKRRKISASYGFRPGRGCKDALRQVDTLLKSGHSHVVDIDINPARRDDAIPHDRLMKLVGERIADREAGLQLHPQKTRDHRWPNRYFAELGLFCLEEARVKEFQSP